MNDPTEHDAADDPVAEEPTDRGVPSVGSRAVPTTLLPSRRRTFLMGDTIVDLEAQTEISRGTVVAGEYEVQRRIARCDLGVLYDVMRKSNGRPCALKALERASTRGASERAHFAREARIASRIDSPHCPAVIASGADPATDVLWIALDRLVGETLAARLARLGVGVPMEGADALEVVAQLGRGLASVHDVGVVHGDLKPANVFLSPGEPFTVKLLDFSAARAVNEPDNDDGPLGTPLWMSPEQAAGSVITPATDVWSVGLLAFRMLTGRSYWLGARNAVVEMKTFLDELIETPLQTASERCHEVGCERELPAGFDAWFSRCVARDPRRRFRNADEMTLALRDVGQRPSMVSPPPARVVVSADASGRVSQVAEASATASQTRRERHDAMRASSAGMAPAMSASQSPPQSAPPSATQSAAPQSAPPPLSSPPPPSLDNPVSFAFFNEEKTRTIQRPAPARPWKLIALGFSLGVMLVAGTLALLHIAEDDDGSLSVAAAVNDPRRAFATIAAPSLPRSPDARAADPSALTPPGSNVARAETPSDSGTNACEWGAQPRRAWRGRATGDDGEWTFALTLTRADGDSVRGYFAWTAARATEAREGEQVRESVEGTWIAATGELRLRGVTSTASDLLPVNGYRLTVSATGALEGTTLDERGRITAEPAANARRSRRVARDDE